MTTKIINPTAVCETPFQMLARLTAEADALEEERAELEERIKANNAERIMVAQKIYADKLTDANLSLSPTFKMRKQTKVNNAELRDNFPEIWKRSSPYVSDNAAMDILEAAHGGNMDEVQDILRTMSPELYAEKAKVKTTTLEKVITASERMELEQAGVLRVEYVPVGEARVMSAQFAAALKSQRQPKTLKAAEEDD